ncbi:hypothetical protein N0V93_010351 [Gnomoniopsis smithogilvyi]|uniref:Uncharacterized protein n=1 Tax=Gnomoniopsis smithogilvyi TaxID=1191159 RepID=A0A9W9CRU7_9PEZI|nr:hypothetical protein N0V93_010351 [Gnomoniopsis smithogilvyi]
MGGRNVSCPYRQAQVAAAREACGTQLNGNFMSHGSALGVPPHSADEAERQIEFHTRAASDVDKGLLRTFYREIYNPCM